MFLNKMLFLMPSQTVPVGLFLMYSELAKFNVGFYNVLEG